MIMRSNIIKQSKKPANVNGFNWPFGWDCYYKIRFFMHEHNFLFLYTILRFCWVG